MNDVEIYLNLLKTQRDQLEIQLVQTAAQKSQLEERVKELETKLAEFEKEPTKGKKIKKAADLPEA